MPETLTILAIDDSETDQHLYSRALRKTGHVLLSALNAADGLAKYSEVKPDLILLDYNLPDLDGLTVLRRLAGASAACPAVVMLTGAGDETVAVDAMKAGASDYLVKDISGAYLRELPHVIRRAHASFEEHSRIRRLHALNSAILTTVADGILGIDGEGAILFANPAAERMLLASPRGLVGRHLGEFVHQNGALDTWQNHPLSAAHGGGASLRRDSDFFRRSGGTSFPVACNASALDFEESGRFGWVLAFQDITERKAAEEALRRHKEELEIKVRERTADLVLARDSAEAANNAKNLFLANMSHQLRTPLNAILGFSAMLCSDPQATREQRERLGIINRNGEDLLALINDILEITKIEAGHQELDIAPFDPGTMVRGVADMMRLRAEEIGLWLNVDQSSAVPRYIRGDGGRLREILINILDNAVKFTRTGGITIRLDLKRAVRSHLVIEVNDTGPGIPPEDLRRLFQPFERLGETATQKGAGLGLVIARQLVELMGGTIGVTSEVGKGSVFRVEVPVEVVGTAAAREQAVDDREVVGLTPGCPHYRILIADDQLENQTLMKQLMQKIGLDAKVVANGRECVKVFQEWHPHLIWMDRGMPVMSGIEAAQCIRKLPGGQDVKIIAVTAAVFKEQQREMLDAGMDDLVRKPYRFREIYRALAKQLDVDYVYDGTAFEAVPMPATLTPEMLAVLPAHLRENLRAALEALDSSRIEAILHEVRSIDRGLGRVLMRMSEDFDYPAMLKALSAATAAVSAAQ